MMHSIDESHSFASLLLEDGLIKQEQWQTALSIWQQQGGQLIEILMGLCPLSEDRLYQSVARQLGLPFWKEQDLTAFSVPHQLIQKFPLFLMMEHTFLPIKEDVAESTLHLILPNPLDKKTLDAIKLYAEVEQLAIAISTPSALLSAIQIHSQHTNPLMNEPPYVDLNFKRIGTPMPQDGGRQMTPPNAVGFSIAPPKIEIKPCPACAYPVPVFSERCTRCSSPMNLSNADPLLGKKVGRFLLEKKLGEGGMGLVYMAKDMEFSQDVAIKILRSQLSTDERVVRRFHREAQAQNQLRHPNIVYVHDFGYEEGIGFFIAMEFLKGVSLDDAISKRPDVLTISVIHAILHQVCDAMGFAHSRGIFHRDLKPENIFLLDDRSETYPIQHVKILDFGVAKMVASEGDQRLTRTGMTIGTPRYMSPEQAGEGSSDHRADIYSLGVILFEILTGEPPFKGSSAYQVMLRHVYANPPLLSDIRKDLPYPEELEQLVCRTLSKDPQVRPASMDMLWHELSASFEQFSSRFSPHIPLLKTVYESNQMQSIKETNYTGQPLIVGRMITNQNLSPQLSPQEIHFSKTPSNDTIDSASHFKPTHTQVGRVKTVKRTVKSNSRLAEISKKRSGTPSTKTPFIMKRRDNMSDENISLRHQQKALLHLQKQNLPQYSSFQTYMLVFSIILFLTVSIFALSLFISE